MEATELVITAKHQKKKKKVEKMHVSFVKEVE